MIRGAASPDRRVARRERDGERFHRHESERDDEALLASLAIDVGAQDDGADGSHEVAGAEGHERQHERRKLARGRKERLPDVRGVVPVHDEVVHLQEVAARDAEDGADMRAARRFGHCRHLCGRREGKDDVRRVRRAVPDGVVGRDHAAVLPREAHRCWGWRRNGESCCWRCRRGCGVPS